MPNVGVPAILFMIFVFLSILAAWIVVILRLAFGLHVLPPRTPRYVPWGVGSVILAIVAWAGLQIFVQTFYLLAFYPRQPGVAAPVPDLSPAVQMTLSAVGNALILLFIPLLLALTCKARRQDLGIVTQGFFQQIFRGMVAYPLIAPVVFGAMLLALRIWDKTPHPLEDAIKSDHSPGMLTIMVLAGVVFAPLSEELIFRGVLLGWLTRLVMGRPKPQLVDEFLDEPGTALVFDPFVSTESRPIGHLDHDPYNPYAAPVAQLELPVTQEPVFTPSRIILLGLANLFVSLIFAGLHAPVWPTPIPLFFLSLALGVLYQRTGSVLPAMALHVTFNGVSTLLMLLTLGNVEPKKIDPKPPEAPKVEAKAAAVISIRIDQSIFAERAH